MLCLLFSRYLCKILEYPQWVSGFVVAVRSESGYISEMTRSLCASSTTNYLQRLEGPFLFFQFFCNHTYLVPDWNSFLFWNRQFGRAGRERPSWTQPSACFKIIYLSAPLVNPGTTIFMTTTSFTLSYSWGNTNYTWDIITSFLKNY